MSARPPAIPTREYATVGPSPLARGLLGRLGDYHLLRKLGQGGMGEIFLAKRIGVGGFEKAVVLKCMLDSLAGSQEFVAMFFDEARLAAQLSHPSIAQIHDFGVAEGRYYIAMEYIAGEDLTGVINHLRAARTYIPVALAARLMMDVCAGLEYAHTLTEDGRPLGIIHRDVSPSNIMVSYQGAVKLLDFGIAKATSRISETRSGSIKGKLSFLAPELIRGLHIDPRADLFSLGITLFAILTREHPFQRDSEIATAHAISDGDAPDPRDLRPDLPQDMVDLLRRALARDREQRFASAAQMGAALQEVVARHAPATGSAQLATFLTDLFGRERRDEKSQVPNLSRPGLEAVPTPVPTLLNASPPMSSLDGPTRGEDRRIGGQRSVVAGGRGRSRPLLRYGLLAGGALLLTAAGGLLLGRGGFDRSAPLVTVPVPPRGTPAPLAPPTAPAAPAPPPASPAVADPTADPRRRARPPRVARAALVPLDQQALHAVVQKAHPRLVACMSRHAADLPGGTGQVKVEVTVAGSGMVTAARAALPGPGATQLASCLEREARGLRFARHPDREIRFAFPLVYRRGE